MSEATNQQRAAWAKVALDAYVHAKRERPDPMPQQDDTADLICDLLHLLLSRSGDTDSAIRCAVSNFEAELAEGEAQP